MSIIIRLCTSIAKKIYPTLERWIPLPPEDKRQSFGGILSADFLIPGLRLARSPDFLIYKHLIFSLWFMLMIVGILAIDASFSLGLFIDPAEFARRPLLMAVIFRNLSVLPWVLITAAFYVRTRLPMNLALDPPPINCHPALLDDPVQSNWVMRSATVLVVAPVIVCFSYGFVFGLTRYLDKQDSVFTIILGTSFIAVGAAGMSVFFVMHAILIEKAYKYFNDLKIHLAEMARERDTKTDKYIKNKK